MFWKFPSPIEHLRNATQEADSWCARRNDIVYVYKLDSKNSSIRSSPASDAAPCIAPLSAKASLHHADDEVDKNLIKSDIKAKY
jgi:DNA-binding IclR family transcriptional regulator